MATATVTTVEIPAIKKKRIDLSLSHNEAEALALILGKVGGDPKRSRRKHAGAIYSALRKLGIHTSAITGGAVTAFPGQVGIIFNNETLDPSKD